MKLAFVLCLCVFVLAGCGAASDGGPKPDETGETRAASREIAPATARIVCARSGTSVLTPKVRARPDGVHFEISNRLGKDAGYAVVTPEGGMGSDAPKGASSHVGTFPPGKLRIGCHPSINEHFDYANLTVLVGSSGYRSAELECPTGRSVSSGGGLYAPGTEGEKGDPVSLVRRRFSEKLNEGYIVEIAGYPEGRSRRTVRAVRDGRVAAVFEYRRVRGGWLENGYSACAGF